MIDFIVNLIAFSTAVLIFHWCGAVPSLDQGINVVTVREFVGLVCLLYVGHKLMEDSPGS